MKLRWPRRRRSPLDGELLADLSHELRTPLASILGYAELLVVDADDLAPEPRRMLEAIRRNAGRQAQVLDNLATLADIRRGDFVRPNEPVDLADVVGTLPEETETARSARQIKLELSQPTRSPVLPGDARRLRQAIVELVLGIAARSDTGGTVSVALAARPGQALLTISGPTTGGAGGSRAGVHGVGLAMARAVVTEHRGEVRCASTGESATTVVRLPVPTRGRWGADRRDGSGQIQDGNHMRACQAS